MPILLGGLQRLRWRRNLCLLGIARGRWRKDRSLGWVDATLLRGRGSARRAYPPSPLDAMVPPRAGFGGI